MKDKVNSPEHYKQGQFETIDIIDDIVESPSSYYTGNIIKYLSRYKHKNGVEDLKKAQWYLNRLIEYEQKEEYKKHVTHANT